MFDLWAVNFFVYSSCKQCCGSGMFIPDPTFFHPGSRIRTVSIPDPGSSSKNLSILTQKKSKKYDPGCSSRIPDPDADFLPSRIPNPGVKKHPIPDPGSGSATLHIRYIFILMFFCGWDLAKWFELLTANAEVATVLGLIPASFDTVETEGRQITPHAFFNLGVSYIVYGPGPWPGLNSGNAESKAVGTKEENHHHAHR